MGINLSLLRNVSAREIISALVRDSAFDGGDGSHQIYYHPDGRRVTVMFHGAGSTFTRKTLKSMISLLLDGGRSEAPEADLVALDRRSGHANNGMADDAVSGPVCVSAFQFGR